MIRYIAAAALALTAAIAPAKTYRVSGTVNYEEFNFEDTTGQGLGPLREGDVIRGNFDFLAVPRGTFEPHSVFYDQPAINGKFYVFRDGVRILTITQQPRTYANGMPVPQSQLDVTDRDSRNLRDVATLYLDGGDAGSGQVLTISPDNYGIDFATLIFNVFEPCAQRNAANQCINDPATDFYDGTNGLPFADLDHYIAKGGQQTGALGLIYANGDNAFYETTLNIAAVPEPATWGLLLVGFGGLGIAMRRRKIALA